MTNYLLFFFLALPVSLHAQKKNKVDGIEFCGWKMNSKESIRSAFQSQFDFLNVQENDTIVDIGASSGSYEGCFLAVSDLKNVSFILVDIDSACLNPKKVNNMIAHYSAVKGDSLKNHFQPVLNTLDSLYLPKGFQKIWMFNTLHEIPDQPKMVRSVYSILKPGGEIVILELSPRHAGQLHGGCRKPLLSFDAINRLFTTNGFSTGEKKLISRKRNFDVMMIRFIKPQG